MSSALLHITGWVERPVSIICLWLSAKPQSLFIVITQLNIILVLERVCYHAEVMLSSWVVTVCGSEIDVMPPTPFTPPDDLTICTSHQITPHHFKWIWDFRRSLMVVIVQSTTKRSIEIVFLTPKSIGTVKTYLN